MGTKRFLFKFKFTHPLLHPCDFWFIYSQCFYYSYFVKLYFLLTRLSSISSPVQYPYSPPLFFLLLMSHVCNCAHQIFFFFLISSCHQSVLLKFFASSSDLLHQFLSFFLLLFFFSLQIHARISNRKIKFHQRLTIGPAYGLNNFSSQTSVQVVLSYFLYSRFSCIKNYFDERFTVNLVEPYGSVRV